MSVYDGKTETAEEIVRAKLADGRTISTPDVMGLLDEIERLQFAAAQIYDLLCRWLELDGDRDDVAALIAETREIVDAG